MVCALQAEQRASLRETAGVRVVADAPSAPCSKCGGPMLVQKTVTHSGLTLAHGAFEVRETVYACVACARPRPDGKLAHVISRQREVASLLLPRSTVGYDVMVLVGLQRHVHFRQREEIRATLDREYGIVLSTGEVSTLARRFLVYLEALHKQRAPQLRMAMEADGGWPLHMDSTGEDGRGTLFVVYAGWRNWVLGAWKIPTERADAMLPKLRDMEALFGAPVSIMRDLGKAVTEAARDFVGERAIPVLGCHLHLAKDIGKDLLKASHEELQGLFRRLKTIPALRALARDVGRGLGTQLAPAREEVRRLLEDQDKSLSLPEGDAGLALVRALSQWVLDYPHDGTDDGFPFDRPMLDCHQRCLRACRAVESLLWKPYTNQPAYNALQRLHRILEHVRAEVPFQKHAATLEVRARLFDSLRDALRLKPKQLQHQGGEAPHAPDDIQDVEKALRQFEASLKATRPERGPARDTREAHDLILEHLQRHGPSLFGHVIPLPPHAGGSTRLVERTNVRLESFFHQLKHGERRRSGRKVLTQDFEQLPAAAALAQNLLSPSYVAALCGALEDLPTALASLDAEHRAVSLPARIDKDTQTPNDVVSSSLPRLDRDLVRTEAMGQRVEVEARSRAPRQQLRRQASPVAG